MLSNGFSNAQFYHLSSVVVSNLHDVRLSLPESHDFKTIHDLPWLVTRRARQTGDMHVRQAILFTRAIFDLKKFIQGENIVDSGDS
jgi:hypothetical protein